MRTTTILRPASALAASVGPEAELGASLASLGDLDGNGVHDVAIGAPGVAEGEE